LGVQRVFNQASMDLIKREREFPHFLSSMKLQATLLQNSTNKTQLKVEVVPLKGASEEIKGLYPTVSNWLIEALMMES